MMRLSTMTDAFTLRSHMPRRLGTLTCAPEANARIHSPMNLMNMAKKISAITPRNSATPQMTGIGIVTPLFSDRHPVCGNGRTLF